jgi:hypothetical protein
MYGKQAEALKIMNKWLQLASEGSGFKQSKSNRILTGHVGPSPSHLIAEHQFESLADWESALKDMSDPRFVQLSDALAPLIVAGSQHWEVYRIIS